ncbi:hypothetical protein D3C71_1650130 [compost metagenome]
MSASSRATVPSSIQPQAMAVMTPAVFQAVARTARSMGPISSRDVATKPNRKPVATFLDRLERYTVRSGASAAMGGGASGAR